MHDLASGLYLDLGRRISASRLPHWTLFTYHLCIRRQDCYMGDIGGVAQAGASIANTDATNAQNLAITQMQDQFNAQQAGINRAFQASQAGIQRQYQTGERLATQAYDTQMSDTAIQRREADLKAAGVNPLLAVSSLGGGASAPMSQPMSGAMPGGSAASAAGSIPMQVPNLSALAQLQLTNAQTANTQADTNKKRAEGAIADAQANIWAMDTTPEMLMKRNQAIMAGYDLDYAKAQQVNEAVNMIKQASAQADLQTQSDHLRNFVQSMDADTQRATMGQFIAMKNAIATQQTTEATNVNAVQQGMLKNEIAAGQALATPLNSAATAVGIGGKILGGIKSLIP